jgi:hypothetical protein
MYITWIWVLLAVILVACTAPAAQATPTMTASQTTLPTATLTLTPSIIPTITQTFTVTPIRTPPALPGTFQTDLLGYRGTPHTYIKDTCQYLQDKWSSTNSPPGTAAIVIMFHSITKPVTSGMDMSEAGFKSLIQGLHNKGFQTVTSTQLADFLEHNTKIPPLSVILIQDDRHPGNVSLEFMPYLTKYNWTLTLAWPIGAGENSTDYKPASNVLPGENYTTLWQQMEAYYATGRLDIQAHGVEHNTPMWPGVSDGYIMSELQGSIDAIKAHFNETPIAIIWPGGGFSTHSVRYARELGYRLGFTTSPRGPMLFNWIPLGDVVDPRTPSWAPEGSMNDPLIVLPRYWDTDALKHLDDVIQISQQATANAEKNKATELEYYDIVCAQKYGPIP